MVFSSFHHFPSFSIIFHHYSIILPSFCHHFTGATESIGSVAGGRTGRPKGKKSATRGRRWSEARLGTRPTLWWGGPPCLHGAACGTGETLPVCRTAALCPQIVVAGTQSEVHWQREPRMPSKSHELQTSQNGVTEELPGAAGGIRPYNMPGDQHRPYICDVPEGCGVRGPHPQAPGSPKPFIL